MYLQTTSSCSGSIFSPSSATCPLTETLPLLIYSSAARRDITPQSVKYFDNLIFSIVYPYIPCVGNCLFSEKVEEIFKKTELIACLFHRGRCAYRKPCKSFTVKRIYKVSNGFPLFQWGVGEALKL